MRTSGNGDATFFETSAERRNDAGWLELQNEITQRFFIVSNIRYDANEDFGDHVTWRVAPVNIVPGTETKLKATYGTGFKAPSLDQQYVNFFPDFLANPNLKPEESKGWDVGFEQPLANDRIRFGSTYFRNDINNLITTVDTTMPGVVTLGNVNTASTFGAENFAAWQVSKDLNLRADYTYTVAKAELGECCLHVSSLLGPATAAAAEEQGVLDGELAGDEPAVGVRDAALCWPVVGYRSSGRAARRLQSLHQGTGLYDRQSGRQLCLDR